MCSKCGIDTVNSVRQPLWLCKICSENREVSHLITVRAHTHPKMFLNRWEWCSRTQHFFVSFHFTQVLAMPTADDDIKNSLYFLWTFSYKWLKSSQHVVNRHSSPCSTASIFFIFMLFQLNTTPSSRNADISGKIVLCSSNVNRSHIVRTVIVRLLFIVITFSISCHVNILFYYNNSLALVDELFISSNEGLQTWKRLNLLRQNHQKIWAQWRLKT